MLRMRHVIVALTCVPVIVGLGLAISIAGDPIYRHSGTVVAVERAAIILGEVGPRELRDGDTVITERRVVVTQATEFVAVYRDYDNVTGFGGYFKEAPRVDWELRPGDTVTFACERWRSDDQAESDGARGGGVLRSPIPCDV